MIIEEIKKIKSSKEELKKFGITFCIVLSIWAAIFFWRKNDYYFYFLIASAVFLLSGLIIPWSLWPIHKIWMSLVIVWGWLIGKVVLLVLFYLVFTPIGLLSRLFGKRFLDLKIDKEAKTYWTEKQKQSDEKVSYEWQF